MQGPEYACFSELVDTARRYCQVIEQLPTNNSRFSLAPLLLLLPRLHAAVAALQDVPAPAPPPADNSQDMDHRFELFSRLRTWLGRQDSYWMEYDEVDFNEAGQDRMSGSLADDLTDIYFELKQGLHMLGNRSPAQVAGWWQSSFQLHWGQHLVDAERHLYVLRASGRLQQGSSPEM